MTGGDLVQPEIPGVIVVPAHPSRYHARPSAPAPYDLVVVHITSGHPDPRGTAEMWRQPADPPGSIGTAAHIVVGSDLAIQAVALRFAANHAHRVNGRSVGIEHTARQPNEPGWPKGDPGLLPTPELYARSARIAAYLLKAAGLPVIKGQTIDGHASADPETTHKDCPDSVWDWTYYLPLVVAAHEQIGMVPNVG